MNETISVRGMIGLGVLLCCCSHAEVSAQGWRPEEAVRRMTVAEGFVVELVAAEPVVRQPVAIDFDDRGRLWVLQYLQYPNPAGLTRVKVDRYSRTTYDRVPRPPPHGPRGADRLTILVDTDGDGRADQSKDFISGLNLATGFAFGYGGVFVLQSPYLLFYADRDRDDIPDGDPDVLLQGFGMEDTSSLANSLVWGPDGWLYGTQGTNLTASIRGIEFEQALWRYHPVAKRFELFAEGGANMWGLDFDRSGNLLAGTNYGGYLMLHGVQGAYYQKSFAKHGELHNRFAFGYFGHVPHENFQGGHVTVGGFVYQGDAFPPRFRDKYIAVDTLGHAVRWHHLQPNGSTVRSENGGVLLQANDTWFAPSDAVMGPDGAVYVADWYDQRTAHPDPDAQWDRSNGRIYRLRWNDATPVASVDVQSLSNEQLLQWLTSSNEWRARRSRRVLAERSGEKPIAQLRKMLNAGDNAPQTLHLLWALHAVGGLDDRLTSELLRHHDPSVRAWAVRLFADKPVRMDSDGSGNSAPSNRHLSQQLVQLAKSDPSPIVIRQLASTAKRLPVESCIPIVRAISSRSEFASDPYIPLLVWWAVERHAVSGIEDVLSAFAGSDGWQLPLVREEILGRLMRRFAGDGSRIGLTASARLLASAPDETQRRRMIAELDAGLKMRGQKKLPRLPLPESILAIKQGDDQRAAERLKGIPAELVDMLSGSWNESTTDPLILRVSTRLGSQRALRRCVELAVDKIVAEKTRLAMLAIMRELGDPDSCVDPALELVVDSESIEVQLAAVELLGRFADPRISEQLLIGYSDMQGRLRTRTRDVLLARAGSALAFLQQIDRGTYPAEEVTADQLRRIAVHQDAELDSLVRKHWGNIRAGTPEEKLAEIRRLNNDLRAGLGDVDAGRMVFEKNCANCHQLFGKGKEIGPNLTTANRGDLNFLLVSMVDPNAQIRKEYMSYIVMTVDGRVLTGLLAKDTGAGVTVHSANDQQTTIPREEIEAIKVSPVSLMPENVLKELTPQQLRDLVKYLQSSGN